MIEVKSLPQLRFPEFKEEYLKKEFSEIVRKQKKTYNPNRDSENFRCIELESLSQNTGQLLKTFDSIELKSNKTVFSKNDVLFGKLRPYLKKYWFATFDGVCTSEIWVFQGKLVSNSYLFYIIQSDKFSYEANVSSGSKMPRTDWSYLSGIKFSIPSVSEEQQKIASFLTAVDKKIAELTKKKALLEQYKKGLMQRIFSQEIRFKDDDGKNYPEWETKRLKEFIHDFIVPMRDKPKDLTGEIPWCRIEDFEGKYLSKSKTNQGVTEKVVRQMNLKVYPVNTLLVSCSANLGFCAIVQNELITNQTFIGLFPDLNRINVDFLYHIMKLSSRRLNILSSGTTISYLSRKQFENFKIHYPCMEEQNKIASILSAIDDKISQLDNQIEKTTAFKKGLLQQMFI